jgi:hypothetical protein
MEQDSNVAEKKHARRTNQILTSSVWLIKTGLYVFIHPNPTVINFCRSLKYNFNITENQAYVFIQCIYLFINKYTDTMFFHFCLLLLFIFTQLRLNIYNIIYRIVSYRIISYIISYIVYYISYQFPFVIVQYLVQLIMGTIS